jgi:predicted negative regulator of RcsB-dependent stress response
MANLDHVLQQLRDERGRTQQQLQQLDSAISMLEGLGGNNSHARTSSRAGRVVSALARRRMAAAQRARWAKARQASGKSAGRPRVMRVLSADARRRIAAAQKARWARFRAEKKAA